MLHTDLPQPLCCSVVQQLKTNDGLKLVKLGQRETASNKAVGVASQQISTEHLHSHMHRLLPLQGSHSVSEVVLVTLRHQIRTV